MNVPEGQLLVISIDTFAVGITLSLLGESVLRATVTLAVVTFLFSIAGLYAGHRGKRLIGTKVEFEEGRGAPADAPDDPADDEVGNETAFHHPRMAYFGAGLDLARTGALGAGHVAKGVVGVDDLAAGGVDDLGQAAQGVVEALGF